MNLLPKTFFLVFLFLFLFAGAMSAQENNAINGTVSDPNGSVVTGANVTLRRNAEVYTTTTDGSGQFLFTNAKSENYLLTVNASGFDSFSINTDGKRQDLKISLSIASAAATVVIQPETETYLAESSTTGTKLEIPQKDLPQSISVVPQSVLRDRVLIRLTEAGDNVSGVRSVTGYSGTKANNYIIRGFSPGITGNTLRSGFVEYAFLTQRDLVNVDRIEFLKGPASLLYGTNEVGGLVNTITKKPQSEHRYEIGLTGGGFGLFRPTIDATGPLNKSRSLLYRATFAYENGKSYRDFVSNRNAFLAPSLIWKINDRTTLTGELELGRFRNDFDRGFPTEPEFINEDFRKNYAEPETNALNKNINVMLNFTHAFNDAVSIRSGFNHVRSLTLVDATSYGFTQLRPDRRTINRTGVVTDEYSENYNSQNELYAIFSTGKIRHQLVAGGEYARFQYRYFFDQYSLAPIDRINPVYGSRRGFRLFGFNDDSNAGQFGFYVQDQISLLDNLKILVGARAGFVESASRDFYTGAIKNEQTDRNLAPRAGIVYQPLPTTSVYFSYANSFAPNYVSRSRLGEQFNPTTGVLYEGGIKQSFSNNRVLATLALYELKRRNVLVADPNDPTFSFSIQTGEQRSRGIEAELNGQVTRQLNINATYAAVDAVINRDSNPLLVGQRLIGVPKHSGGVYGNYVFDRFYVRGLTIGAGLFLAGESFSNIPNRTFSLPGYGRVDLNFGYRREKWRFDLAVKNLNGARYFETGGFNTMMPQATRHALASVNYNF